MVINLTMMVNMEKLDGAIVGAGNFAKFALQRFTGRYGRDLCGNFNNIYLVDHNIDTLRERGEDFGIPDEHRFVGIPGLEGKLLDFVIVSTPANVHYDTAKSFVSKGIPTFIPKPLDADLEKSKKLVDLAAEYRTLNATGSQMLFNPDFQAAMEYLKDAKIRPRQININWCKERGPRDHPIPGVTVEEGPHPYALLVNIKNEFPSTVYAVGRKGKVIIDPKKWELAQGMDDITILGRSLYKGINVVEGEISMASDCILTYDDGTIARVYNDFQNPHKDRSVQIVGEFGRLYDLFDSSVTLDIDLTDLSEADAKITPYTKKGLSITSGFLSERSGQGRVGENRSSPKVDELGEQLSAFLDYVRTKEKPAGLMSFEENYMSEVLIDAVVKSMRDAPRVLRYRRGSYL